MGWAPRALWRMPADVQLPARLAFRTLRPSLLQELVNPHGEVGTGLPVPAFASPRITSPETSLRQKRQHQRVEFFGRLEKNQMPGIRDHLGARILHFCRQDRKSV